MKALLIVDVQRDFCPGGALAVDKGDEVVSVINAISANFDLVLASRDWHPPHSVHFDQWPVHCVQDTPGAAYHPKLLTSRIDQELFKGTEDRDDGYSAFEATNINLEAYLKKHQITGLYVAGLTTDYCVKATVLDACKKGFSTFLITDAIRAVNSKPGDGDQAIKAMVSAGCTLVTSSQLLAED